MFPTLNSSWLNDVVLVKKLTDPLKEVKEECPVGSVVCLKHPKKDDHFLIKRLSALEGHYKVSCRDTLNLSTCPVRPGIAAI